MFQTLEFFRKILANLYDVDVLRILWILTNGYQIAFS